MFNIIKFFMQINHDLSPGSAGLKFSIQVGIAAVLTGKIGGPSSMMPGGNRRTNAVIFCIVCSSQSYNILLCSIIFMIKF